MQISSINPVFISYVSDIYGEKGKLWLKDLPSILAAISEKRNLHLIKILPDLTYNFVALVEVNKNKTAILKMAPEGNRLERESNCLQCFTKSVPEVYWYDEEFSALLMENLEPGTSLKKFFIDGKDDEATRIICQLIIDLHKHQLKKFEFQHLSDLFPSLLNLHKQINNQLSAKAITLFKELTVKQSTDVILHGDLHHDNILASGENFKAIDPHGYIGDPVFEAGSMISNPCYDLGSVHDLPALIKRRLEILIEELPYSADRIKAWTFCKTMLSVAWTYEDHDKIDIDELQIADIIGHLI